MTNTIKFTGDYHKLKEVGARDGTVCWLMQVLIIDLNDLTDQMREYDTRKLSGESYPLPKKGKYMLLIFKAHVGLFTTIRRWTPKKEEYYKGKICENFTIEIR